MMVEYQFEELPPEVEVDGKKYIRRDLLEQGTMNTFMAMLDDSTHPSEYRSKLQEATGYFFALWSMMQGELYNVNTRQCKSQIVSISQAMKELYELFDTSKPKTTSEGDDYIEVK